MCLLLRVELHHDWKKTCLECMDGVEIPGASASPHAMDITKD